MLSTVCDSSDESELAFLTQKYDRSLTLTYLFDHACLGEVIMGDIWDRFTMK